MWVPRSLGSNKVDIRFILDFGAGFRDVPNETCGQGSAQSRSQQSLLSTGLQIHQAEASGFFELENLQTISPPFLSQKLRSNLRPEVLMLEFLFDPKNNVKDTNALLIAVLLLDLQEDYRHHVKRSVLRSAFR